jgi:AsmA protein
MKLVKKLLLTLTALILLGVTALIVLSYTIDPNQYREQINRILSSTTKKPVNIKGNIRWQVIPQLGFNLNDVSIGSAKSDFYFHTQSLSTFINMLPLLSGDIKIDKINADGFNAQISLADKSTPSSTKKSPPSSSTSKKSQKKITPITIKRLNLKNGQVHILSPKQTVEISNLSVSLKDFSLDDAFHVDTKATVKITTNDTEPTTIKATIKYLGVTQIKDTNINNVKTQGNITIKKLMINQLQIDKVSSSLNLASAKLSLNDVNASLYQGKIKASLTLNLNNNQFSFSNNIENINASPFITDLLHSNIISGRLNANLTLEGILSKIETFNGNATVNFKNGQLNRIDLDAIEINLTNFIQSFVKNNILDVLSHLGNSFKPEQFKQKSTPFNLLTGRLQIANGIIYNKNLTLNSKKYIVKGQGNINLVNKTIDYKLALNSTSKNKYIKKAQKMLGGNFPITIKGSLSNPKTMPDVGIINHVLKDKTIKKTIKKQLNNLKALFF